MNFYLDKKSQCKECSLKMQDVFIGEWKTGTIQCKTIPKMVILETLKMEVMVQVKESFVGGSEGLDWTGRVMGIIQKQKLSTNKTPLDEGCCYACQKKTTLIRLNQAVEFKMENIIKVLL